MSEAISFVSLEKKNILDEMQSENISNPAVRSSINTTIDMLATHTLYGNKPFAGSYRARDILETSLFNQVNSDLELIDKRVKTGEDRSAVIKELGSREHFLSWYQGFITEVQSILK